MADARRAGPVLDVNVENEQIVLGALLKDRGQRDAHAPRIPESALQDPVHRALLSALKTLVIRGADSAPDSIVQLTGERVPLKYLYDLGRDFDALPEVNLKIHLEQLERDAGRAQAREPFARLYAAMDDPHSKLEEVESEAMAVVRAARSRRQGAAEVSGEDAWADVYEDAEEARTGVVPFVPFHFSGLDDVLTEGRRPGRMTVIAARPGIGKSTWAANLAMRAKQNTTDRILACPFEDGRQAMVERMAYARARLDAVKMIRDPKSVSDMEALRFKKAMRELFSDGQITFADTIRDVDELEATVSVGDYRLVLLDLFDYLVPGDAKPKEVTEILRRVRNLSKPDKAKGWRGFHTLVFHQIRRIKRVKNVRPFIHELKDSGGYEEVADQIMLLHRERYYKPDSPGDVLEVFLAKQRRGVMNVTVCYEFQAGICRVGGRLTDADRATDLEVALGRKKPKAKDK